MNTIWTFYENRFLSAFKTLLDSNNSSLFALKIIFSIAIVIIMIKLSFDFKRQFLNIGPILTAVMNSTKVIYITMGNKICDLFLLKSKTSFLLAGSFLSMVIFLISEYNLRTSHIFVLSWIIILYFWALIYYILQFKTEKNPQKKAENSTKTQEKSSYSNEKYENSDLVQSYQLRTEIQPSPSNSINNPDYLRNNECKRSTPPRSKIKKEHDKKFYESRDWRELRFQIFNSHGRRCALCQTLEGIFHVDHIKPRSKYPHLELTASNLQVLCEDCNLGKSDFDG